MAESDGWEAQARALIGREFPPVLACDPVNAPMIRHWREAMGLPLDWDDAREAPASMLQCWLFHGPSKARPPGSALEDATSAHAVFARGGYTQAVTVSTEYEFLRTLRSGDELHYVSILESFGDEKRTALGPGRFLDFQFTVRLAGGEAVGRIRFTNLVYRPQ